MDKSCLVIYFNYAMFTNAMTFKKKGSNKNIKS